MSRRLSDIVRLALAWISEHRARTLDLEIPNGETRAAIEESREMMRCERARFTSAEELFDALDKASKP